MNVLRVILSGVAAKDPGQTPCVILSEATLVAKPKDLGGPALPRRHALFYGPASRLRHPAALVKPSLASLMSSRTCSGITVLVPEPHTLSGVKRVSALACNDRCRETLEDAA